jgi:hypothetical protein
LTLELGLVESSSLWSKKTSRLLNGRTDCMKVLMPLEHVQVQHPPLDLSGTSGGPRISPLHCGKNNYRIPGDPDV